MQRERCARSVLVALIAVGLGADARAKECSNPCEVGDGDICVSTLPVVELGRSITMHAGRQGGTCGGVVPMATADLAMTWSPDPAGPFTPIPVTRRGDSLVVKPDRAGPLFIQAAARDGVGAPDQRVIMVVDPTAPAVELRLRPGKGVTAANTTITVRWLPSGSVDRFPRRRWPVWWDNDTAGLAERRMRLPPGRYDVEWMHRQGGRTQRGVTTIDVTGAGPIDVALVPTAR